MAKSDLINKREYDFARQMMMFKENIGSFAALLGLTPAQVTAQAADAEFYNHVVTGHHMVQTHAKAWTALKKALRRSKPTELVCEVPVYVLPAPVPAVTPGVEARFRLLAQQVKASPNYNRGIGLELGIEAVDHAEPDYTMLQPRFTATVSGDHVELGWDWQGQRAFLDLCEFQADRNDGHGFVSLTFTLNTRYHDPTPFPATPVKWCYRAIFRVGDAPVGQWSNIVGVNVPP